MTADGALDGDGAFLPPSISAHNDALAAGDSYAHYSAVPPACSSSPCVLGIDEAGRGPVLGPMVYSAFYLPADQQKSLLSDTYHFNDSKVLNPGVRLNLMRQLCTDADELHQTCGWAVKVISARDISYGMSPRHPSTLRNLNMQAMDATVEILRGALSRAINIQEVFVDTIGKPEMHQKRLEAIFPSLKITVAKKADSLYPCVSAASVCAKVTRDLALVFCYKEIMRWRENRALASSSSAGKTENASADADTGADAATAAAASAETEPEGWGSGYPSDFKCVRWLRRNMHPLFGWGNECRFSWGTARDLLEDGDGLPVYWPHEDETGIAFARLMESMDRENNDDTDEFNTWYGGKSAQIF